MPTRPCRQCPLIIPHQGISRLLLPAVNRRPGPRWATSPEDCRSIPKFAVIAVGGHHRGFDALGQPRRHDLVTPARPRGPETLHDVATEPNVKFGSYRHQTRRILIWYRSPDTGKWSILSPLVKIKRLDFTVRAIDTAPAHGACAGDTSAPIPRWRPSHRSSPCHSYRSNNSALNTEFSVSVIALSYEPPLEPTDATASHGCSGVDELLKRSWAASTPKSGCVYEMSSWTGQRPLL